LVNLKLGGPTVPLKLIEFRATPVLLEEGLIQQEGRFDCRILVDKGPAFDQFWLYLQDHSLSSRDAKTPVASSNLRSASGHFNQSLIRRWQVREFDEHRINGSIASEAKSHLDGT
jgi:hypothetical protein